MYVPHVTYHLSGLTDFGVRNVIDSSSYLECHTLIRRLYFVIEFFLNKLFAQSFDSHDVRDGVGAAARGCDAIWFINLLEDINLPTLYVFILNKISVFISYI